MATPEMREEMRRLSKTAILLVIMLIFAVSGSIWGAFAFVEAERSRSLQEWQVRLSIVADSRKGAVEDWLELHFSNLRELAENASLQLYMTQLALSREQGKDLDLPEAQYLRNLLAGAAIRFNFTPEFRAFEIDANVERPGTAGLALLDDRGRVVVRTPSMPPIEDRFKQEIKAALDGRSSLIDIHVGVGGRPSIGFALPVFAMQETETTQVGVILGIRPVGEDFHKSLFQPGISDKTSETYLVRRSGETVEYLTKLIDGSQPGQKILSVATAQLGDVWAMANHGGFSSGTNYEGEAALFVSRAISGTTWTLVRTVASAEALANVEDRLNAILIMSITVIFLITAAFVAVWKHGSSIRASRAAEESRIAAERFENLSKFMTVITNHVPSSIVAVDGETKYTFANEPAAREAGMTAKDMMGKTMSSVIGPTLAQPLAEINARVMANFKFSLDEKYDPIEARDLAAEEHLLEFENQDNSKKIIQTQHVPLRGDIDYPPAVLLMITDVSQFTIQENRQRLILQSILEQISRIIDSHRTKSAGTSSFAAQIASRIAIEIGLKESMHDAIHTAAKLRDISKLIGPNLDHFMDHKQQPDGSDYDKKITSADLLELIEFTGPVSKIVKYSYIQPSPGEDGSRDDEEDINIAGQIVAVSNLFAEKICENESQSDNIRTAENIYKTLSTSHDIRILASLLNYVVNKKGLEDQKL